jgi:PAS domain-containing protein
LVPWLEPGTAFYWLHVPLCYGLALGGVLALFVHAFESPYYLRRAFILSASMLLPTFVNVFVVAQWAKGPDLTPLALAASFALLARTTFRFRLLEVMPAARSLLFQQYRDGVVVLDTEGRVVDANPTIGRMLGAEARPGMPRSGIEFERRRRAKSAPGSKSSTPEVSSRSARS